MRLFQIYSISLALEDSQFCFCLRFLPELLFKKAKTSFVFKIVSLLFVYRFDTLSVTSVYAVHLPKMTFNKEICILIEINDKH